MLGQKGEGTEALQMEGRGVVYFDQLLVAARNRKLVKHFLSRFQRGSNIIQTDFL